LPPREASFASFLRPRLILSAFDVPFDTRLKTADARTHDTLGGAVLEGNESPTYGIGSNVESKNVLFSIIFHGLASP
jgi:hypothetical protein